ncbi:MAG: hypothetical protein RQ824_06165 [bacterium]|nr:hypothetical protein [bacterium]
MVSIELDITFFIQTGLFLLLVYILNVLIYKPVLRVMEERGKKISGMEADALSADKEVEDRLASYRLELDKAKQSGNADRAILKKEGLDKEAELLDAAHAEAQKTLSAAKDKISKETDAALAILKGLTEDMGKDIAAKVVGRAG